MARYRKIDTRIWNDEKFRNLSDKARLVFFMLLTHPHMTAIGAMRATIPGLASEMGWPDKGFREAFLEVSMKGMVKHDENACLVYLPRFLKYNPPESPNVVKAWVDSLDMLPECKLKTQVIQNAKAFTEGLTEAFNKALPEAFAKSMPNQEQEQEQEYLEFTNVNSYSGNDPEKVSPEIQKPPEKPKPERNGKHAVAIYIADAEDVIAYLNKATDSRFELKNPTGKLTSNGELIIQRLKDGYTRTQLNEVVLDRCQAWANDPKMREYLRPQTLFAKTNFEKYLGAL